MIKMDFRRRLGSSFPMLRPFKFVQIVREFRILNFSLNLRHLNPVNPIFQIFLISNSFLCYRQKQLWGELWLIKLKKLSN